jgi:hypothetical protein
VAPVSDPPEIKKMLAIGCSKGIRTSRRSAATLTVTVSSEAMSFGATLSGVL